MALLPAALVWPVVFVLYGAVALFGIGFVVLGCVMLSEVGVGTPAAICVVVGVMFMLLAALALLANVKRSWVLMAIALLVAFALCILVMIVTMGALLMATSTMDPVGLAVEKAWTGPNGGMRKEFEMGNTDSAATWDAYKARVYCHDATPAGGRCDAFYKELFDRNKTACSGMKGEYAWNCTLSCDSFSPGICNQCDNECEQTFTDQVKSSLRPLTIFSFFVSIAAFATVLLNTYHVSKIKEKVSDSGKPHWWHDHAGNERKTVEGALTLIVNILVALLGLAIMIVGIVIYHGVDADCPEGQDCDSVAVMFVILFGLFILFCALVATFGTWKGESSIVICGNTLLGVLAFCLLLVTIILGFASGIVSNLKELYDDPTTYAETRAVVDAAGDYCICALADCDDSNIVMPARKFCSCADGAALTEEQCKGKMEFDTEANMYTIGVYCAIVEAFFIVITWFTYEAAAAYRKEAKEGGEGDGEYDEDEYENDDAPLGSDEEYDDEGDEQNE